MKIDLILRDHYFAVRDYVGSEDNVMAVCLYGSQNYGLSNLTSDVDTVGIVIPTMEELLTYNDRSTTIIVDDKGSMSQIAHLGVLAKRFMNQGINLLEILYTDYYFYNPLYKDMFFQLRENRDIISNANPHKLLCSAAGTAFTHYKDFQRMLNAEKPTIGDSKRMRKAVYTILRMEYFIESWIRHGNFRSAITPYDHAYELMRVTKEGGCTDQEMNIIASESIYNIKKIQAETLPNLHLISYPDKAKAILSEIVADAQRKYLEHTNFMQNKGK